MQIREAKAGSSYLGQNDPRLDVGVGTATVTDRIDVKWPSGVTDRLERVPVNALVTVTEGRGRTARVPFRRP